MKIGTLILAFMLADAASLPVSAQTVPLLFKGRSAAPPAGYTGAADVVASPAMWWGLRAMSSATRGTKAINICDNTGSNCIDVNTDATTGFVPNSITVNGNVCNSSTYICLVQTFYDQSGHGFDVTLGNPSAMAAFVPSCGGLTAGLPCILTNGGGSYGSASSYTQAQPYTVIAAANRQANFTTLGNIIANDGGGSGGEIQFASAANSASMHAGAGSANFAATDSAWHAFQGVFNNSVQSYLAVDSTQNASSAGGNGFSDKVDLGGDCCFFRPTMNFVEGGVWPIAFSGANMTAINTNIHTAWGF